MKKINQFAGFFIVLLLSAGLFLNSCTKTEQDENIVTKENNEYTFYSTGCKLLPTEQYINLPVANKPMLAKALATSVTLVTPPVGNQGQQSSCTAWGTTYAAKSTAFHTIYGGAYNYSTNIFSPAYVYNQIKGGSDCSIGSWVYEGLDLLKNQGACLWNTMPYTTTCNTLPNSTQQAEAALYKINSWGTVPITTNDIKTQLAAGKPVIVAGPTNNTYNALANGAVLTSFKGRNLGNHCYCIVGYDDAKNAFKFQNSWGTSWASAGFGWISYNYLSAWVKEAYVIN